MILLDTHIWIWWVNGSALLPPAYREFIRAHEGIGISLSVLSCWEVAKLVQLNRLTLGVPVETWIDQALGYPGMILLPLTPEIAVESCRLPGSFHRDPADQIIVATSRIHDVGLLTVDARIRAYPHVRLLP